jgi:hypothetical protein
MEDMDKRSMRRGQENHEKEHALRVRVTELDLIRALPYGPAASDGRNTRPDTRQHPTTLFIATRKILLASGGASTHVPVKMPPRAVFC